MPLKEVEAKAVMLLDPDISRSGPVWERTRGLVLSKGGSLKRTVEHEDAYLSHPCRDFAERDETLRVRTERDAGPGSSGTPETYLTFKGPKLSPRSKARYEKEVRVSGPHGPEDLEELLEQLGFRKVLIVQKKRAVLDLEGLDVSVDLVKGLGVFAEVELLSEDVKGAEDRVLALMGSLGWTALERRSYLEMLLEKQV